MCGRLHSASQVDRGIPRSVNMFQVFHRRPSQELFAAKGEHFHIVLVQLQPAHCRLTVSRMLYMIRKLDEIACAQDAQLAPGQTLVLNGKPSV